MDLPSTIAHEINYQIEALHRAAFTADRICISLIWYAPFVEAYLNDPEMEMRQGKLPTHYRGCQFIVFSRMGMLRVLPPNEEIIQSSDCWEDYLLANAPPPERRNHDFGYEKRAINRIFMETLAEFAGGRVPETEDDFQRIVRRMRMQYGEVEGKKRPESTYDTERNLRSLIMPVGGGMDRRRQWYVHEISECIAKYPGLPKLNYPAALGSHHDIAKMIEKVYTRVYGI